MAESDIATINAALDTNADWFTSNSPTKCAAWITAATQLLHRAEESRQSGQVVSAQIRVNLEVLREELKFARNWYSKNGTTGQTSPSATGVDFTSFDSRR